MIGSIFIVDSKGDNGIRVFFAGLPFFGVTVVNAAFDRPGLNRVRVLSHRTALGTPYFLSGTIFWVKWCK